MNFRFAVAAALLFLGLAAFAPNPALSQTRLGLHVTQEELDIWKQRASSGPYRSTGDVSTNSPGDWSRIQNNANAFLSNPSAQRWAGQTNNTCRTNSDTQPGRNLGERLRDGGFVYMLTGNTSYRDAVRNELLAQAATAGTDFANSTRWCVNTISPDGLLNVNIWLARLLFGYDYIRSSLSTADRTTLDTWFRNAGVFLEKNTHRFISQRWPNRLNDDYSSSPWPLGALRQIVYFGSSGFYAWHSSWDNQVGSQTRTFGLIGILLDDPTLKERAKRWVKEYIRYGVAYNGTHNIVTAKEYYRWGWHGPHPGSGWGYTSSTLGSVATLADAFARTGDTELYEYTTSEGYNGTEGGPKSFPLAITTHFRMLDHQLKRYGSTTSTSDPNLIIDNIYEPIGWHHIGDVWIAPIVNNYFKNNYWKSIYLRKAPGTTAYPSSPATGGYGAWGGEWGIYPGVLFMFGQMEDKVSVYGGTTTAPTTAPTTGFAKFSIGDRVYVTGTSNVNVRETPGGTLLGQQPPGDQGTVTQGPIAAQIGGSGATYNWWHIDFDPAGNSTSLNPDGWVGDDPLEKVLASASAKLIGHWKFDEGSGTVAKDSSGTGNDANLMNGASWTTGRSGSAVSFDGLDDFVKIATTNFSAAQGTFSAWIRAPFYKSGTQYIFGHTSIPAYGNRIQLYTNDTGGNLIMGLGDNNKLAQNIQQLQTNTWHHVALTWNAGVFAVYVDGVQKTTGSYSGLASFNSYAHIGGVGLDTNPQSWAGAIDEVKIWNGALSATEVQSEYNADQLLAPSAPSNVVAQPAP